MAVCLRRDHGQLNALCTGFYERMGFDTVGARVDTKGIAYVPMELAQNKPF